MERYILGRQKRLLLIDGKVVRGILAIIMDTSGKPLNNIGGII
jgi:hypothetical protein